MLKERTTYEIMSPEAVGIDGSRLVLGKHSGRHALRRRLAEMGYAHMVLYRFLFALIALVPLLATHKPSLDAREWRTTRGDATSLRELALAVATYFADSIRGCADPFSVRLLFSVLNGETPSLLDLADRPPAYDDVGRATKWGAIIPELENFASLMGESESLRSHIATRDARRARYHQLRRRSDVEEILSPPWTGESADRRTKPRVSIDRRGAPPLHAPTLTRSRYESVFLNLGNGRPLQIGEEVLTPVQVKGWYHAIFATANGEERMLSIDQLLKYEDAWV